MDKPYRLSPLAEGDLEEIWLYTLKKLVVGAGRHLPPQPCGCLRGAGSRHGRPVDVLPEFMKYLCGSHVVYFLDYSDYLDVIRVQHQRQDAERHL